MTSRLRAVYSVYHSLPLEIAQGVDASARELAEQKLLAERPDLHDASSDRWACELARRTQALWLWVMDQKYGPEIAALAESRQNRSGVVWSREDLREQLATIGVRPQRSVAMEAADPRLVRSNAAAQEAWEEGRE